MQIVIDIPEEDYEYLKLHNKDGLYNAILNGKPLPKGHGRLIDESKIDWLIDPDVRWTTENRIKSTSETVIEADKESAE